MEALAIYLLTSRKNSGKYFQHNKRFRITLESFAYVREYKRQLMQSMHSLLADLDIKYVISHGCLIEFERQALIYHDDDIDLRYDIKDLPKWERFCKEYQTKGSKYNIKLGDRGQYKNISEQKKNGIHVRLKHFDNHLQLKTFKKIDIFMDFVPSVAELWFKTKHMWPPYDINFHDLRAVEYLGVQVTAPNKKDTQRVLTKQYGPRYLVPDKKLLRNNNPPWRKHKRRIRRVITFGTFDLFHTGHSNILHRAKRMFDKVHLVVGVSSDSLNMAKKGHLPVVSQEDRMQIVRNTKDVAECFLEESLELKLHYCIKYNADCVVMGSDHTGRFDFLRMYGIDVRYLPRTQNVSTTEIVRSIIENNTSGI